MGATFTKKSMRVSSILLALVILSLPACQMHKEEAPHEEHHEIVVTSPLIKDVVFTQQYVCMIHSKDHIEISARAFGVLEEIPVKEGQAVKQGEVMFKVAPRQYQAKYDAEVARFQVARLEYENTKRLAEKSVDGKTSVVSEREVAIFKAKMDEAKGNMEKAETELNFATVRAFFRHHRSATETTRQHRQRRGNSHHLVRQQHHVGSFQRPGGPLLRRHGLHAQG